MWIGTVVGALHQQHGSTRARSAACSGRAARSRAARSSSAACSSAAGAGGCARASGAARSSGCARSAAVTRVIAASERCQTGAAAEENEPSGQVSLGHR